MGNSRLYLGLVFMGLGLSSGPAVAKDESLPLCRCRIFLDARVDDPNFAYRSRSMGAVRARPDGHSCYRLSCTQDQALKGLARHYHSGGEFSLQISRKIGGPALSEILSSTSGLETPLECRVWTSQDNRYLYTSMPKEIEYSPTEPSCTRLHEAARQSLKQITLPEVEKVTGSAPR